ncbi:unnamed protein product [Prunus brigantina]
MKFVSSAETNRGSTTTYSEEPKLGQGYAGLEDQLEETMPGVEIDRSTLWKKARQDKHGNILDPKVAEKAKLIDELQKQVSEGSLTVSGSNDVLTMALGPEHPRRVRGKSRDLEKQDEEKQDEKVNSHNFAFFILVDYSKLEVPSSLQSLCRYVETTLKPQEKIMTFTI